MRDSDRCAVRSDADSSPVGRCARTSVRGVFPNHDADRFMKAATSLLLFSVLGLLVLGIVMLVSASMGQPEARFLIMQPIWAGVGLVACLAGAAIDYRWLKRIWWLLLLLAIAMLACVWVPGLGLT